MRYYLTPIENSSVIKLSLAVTPKNLLEGIKNSYV